MNISESLGFSEAFTARILESYVEFSKRKLNTKSLTPKPADETKLQKLNAAEIKLQELNIAAVKEQDHFDSLNHLRDMAYDTAKSVGFHSNDEKIVIGDFISNIHAEASEFYEAFRANKLDSPCDKSEGMLKCCGESLDCKSEELADLIIRSLDLAATLNIDIARAVRIKNAYNKTRSHRNGNKLT
jgi:NTP pyrophosphatase (non-canonical NTP hydrolase)